MVLEAAVNGQADMLVTYNLADFAFAAPRFGLLVISPADLLRRATWVSTFRSWTRRNRLFTPQKPYSFGGSPIRPSKTSAATTVARSVLLVSTTKSTPSP